MPEVLAVVLVVVVSLFVWGLSWLHVRRTPVDVGAEVSRLEQQIDWLQSRQRQAVETNWDEEMRERLAAQIQEARKQHASFSAELTGRTQRSQA